MENSSYEIEKIRHEIFQKEVKNKKIKELEKLLESPFICNEQTVTIQKKISELKKELTKNQLSGIERLKRFRLSTQKTLMIKDEIQFIYPNFIESGKNIMIFGESGIGKTLMCTCFANYGLENKTIDSAVFFDFDNGLISLKKRKYDQLAERWGEKFDYLLGHEILEEMEPLEALKELLLDGSKNKGKMIVIDSGSHFVYDGSKNERQRLKEFFDVVKILQNLGSTPVILHHSHRVRDGQIADYHGSFEWKRDLDYQIMITKNEDTNTWLFHVKKDRDNLIQSKAFKYNEETITLLEVNYEESNISTKELIFIKEIQEILKDFDEKVNQTELLKESRAMRQSLGLGDKRSIKWLHSFGEKNKWNLEKVASEKNAIFYWLKKNSLNLPNTQEIGA